MKKIFSYLGILLIEVLCLTGCGFGNINDDLDTKDNSLIQTKGNCTATECIKKINPENTVDEINDIIGFDGELIDEKYNKYYWELSEDTGVEVTYYSSDKGTISINYDRDALANSKVDFSKYDELKEKINGGISYSDFISYIGNVDGTIVEKSSYSTKYVWVADDGSYLNGTFSNNSNKCTIVTGRIK